MEQNNRLSPDRELTDDEKALVWKKPASHVESGAERRICEAVRGSWNRGEMKISTILLEGGAGSGKTQLAKALSADFGLPYTKVTCFADMDKSDVLGAILPVLPEGGGQGGGVEYRYYPSEIVRAYENGWLLEIQEPTVIRDAAVLMALNSALEPDGSINLPTRIVRRHPDFIAVITTNRGYNGCRPLNEALRDRVQHSEKMDLPPIEVMMERAIEKTAFQDSEVLRVCAETIILLDKTAGANAIRGVAGMRSYFFWIDAIAQGTNAAESLYHKVIYKMTTDPDEIAILEQALTQSGLKTELEGIEHNLGQGNGEELEIRADGSEEAFHTPPSDDRPAVALKKAADSEGRANDRSESALETHSADSGDGGTPMYHELSPEDQARLEEQRQALRRRLNQEAREAVKGSVHEKVGMIVHRPESTPEQRREYREMASALMPVIQELTRKTEPLLEHETAAEFAKNRVYGSRFHAERTAAPDFRYFSKKNPPDENPSLAVALRVDQSASMNAFGRLEAAKEAAVAVCEFCEACGIPVLIYGDTADRSPRERMSMYAYLDWEEPALNDKHAIMSMRGISSNRDGMSLRVLSEKLVKAPQETKLLISLSDGQPKAMPDYTGSCAAEDMKRTIREYSRKGVVFLAAAIGQDKDAICEIYGQERFIDIGDLRQLPLRLVQIIARYL